jgi:hypothetical protein
MLQKTNVSQGKTKMDKIVRRRGLPCVRRLRSLYSVQVVHDAVQMLLERKSDEEPQKSERKGLTVKDILCTHMV